MSQTDVRALLAGAVTFLIDKRLPGPPLGLNPACDAVARAANRLGFRDSDGARLNTTAIRAMRNELLADRQRADVTISVEQLLRNGIKDRARLGHREYYHLFRAAQVQLATASRAALVERILRRFCEIAPTRRI